MSLRSTDPAWEPQNMDGTYSISGNTLTIKRTGGSVLDYSGRYALTVAADTVTLTMSAAESAPMLANTVSNCILPKTLGHSLERE